MKIRILSLFITISAMASAQTPADTIADQSLHEVTVKARRPGSTDTTSAAPNSSRRRAATSARVSRQTLLSTCHTTTQPLERGR